MPPGWPGLDEVPVIIKDVTDEQAAALALIENLQREDLDPIEVAEGCRQLIDKYGLTQESCREKAGQEPQRRHQQPAPAGPARGCAPHGQRGQAELRPRQGAAGAAQRGV